MKNRSILVLVALAGTLLAQDAPKKLPTFELDEFASRRKAIAEKLDSGWVVAQSRKPRQGWGIEFPTEATIGRGLSFHYLVGASYKGARLVIRGRTGEAVLFCSETPKRVKNETGIGDVRRLSEFNRYVTRTMKQKGGTVYIDSKGELMKDLQDAGLSVKTRELYRTMRALRGIKSSTEREMLRLVCRITGRAHSEAMKASKPGINEREIQKTIEDCFKREGCDALGFQSICGSSANTPVIHYHDNNREVKDGEVILCDVGGSYMGYSADISRTWPINGKFSKLQRKQYQAVLDGIKAAEKILKPGVTWRELDRAASKVIAARGFGNVSYKRVHGLGHYVGLQVHDLGDYWSPMEEGMVITIEPGIYDRENKISIRIEDTYCITKEGFERLSGDTAPREADEIEKLMSQD
jgi:Xaa-Pro aminopeptidase